MPPEHADPPATGPGDPGLRALAGLLRAAGLDPSPEELADALWLAARTREAARAAAPDPGTGREPRPARTPAGAGRAPGRPAGTS
ncbi:hypothetical protein ACFVXK_09160, partial [Streptomyces sp. NPDC058157]